MSEQADIEVALARATAAYKNVSAERDALKDANDRAEAAEAECDRLREALETERVRGIIPSDLEAECDRLREALKQIIKTDIVYPYPADYFGSGGQEGRCAKIARAALAKETGQ